MRTRLWLRTLSCAVVALITVEVCARLDDYLTYGAPFFGAYDINQLYQFDSLGRRGKPHARYKKWRLNSLGYRGPELEDGSTRIAVFGASETFGLYERENGEYPRLLEQRLNGDGAGRLQVVNVAYAGMPVRAMTPRVPEIADRIHPRVALIYPTPASYIWLPWLRSEKAPGVQPEFQIRLAEQLRVVSKRVVPDAIQNWIRNQDILRSVHAYGKVMERVPEDNVNQFRHDIEQLAAALKRHGIEPVLVTHAHRFNDPPTEEDRQNLISWRKFYPMLSEVGLIDMERRMNEALRRVAQENDVALIEAASKIAPGSRYFADFTHFTDEGAGVMANVLASGLKPILQQCCASAQRASGDSSNGHLSRQ